VRCVDATDPNAAVIDGLRGIKRSLEESLADRWRQSQPLLVERLRGVAIDEKATAFPESFAAVLRRPASAPLSAAEFAAERNRRIAHNREHLELIADFTSADPKAAGGWQWEGFGMKHGLVADGELVVPDEGEAAVVHLLPAGRWSHAWSMRLAGAIRSPELFARPPRTISVGYGGGRKAPNSLLIDRAFHTERLNNGDRPPGSFRTFTAGNFSRLIGPPDNTIDRRVSLEIVTKALDNYFPPRVGLGGVTAADIQDPRSWFGVTRVYEHPEGKPPLDELGRLESIFDGAAAPAGNCDRLIDGVAARILAAVNRWAAGSADAEDVLVINEALREKWLDATALDDSAIATLVARYREMEKRLQPDRTIGSMAEWFEGRDARRAIRSRRGSTSTASGCIASARVSSARPTTSATWASRRCTANCSTISRAGSSRRAGRRRSSSARSCRRRPGRWRARRGRKTWPPIRRIASGTTIPAVGWRRSRSATRCSPSPAGSTARSAGRRSIRTV